MAVGGTALIAGGALWLSVVNASNQMGEFAPDFF
jgi:hypothetical protein